MDQNIDMKNFYLMNKNTIILEFKVLNSLLTPIKVIKVYKDDMFIKDLETWITNRVIPTNREHIERVLDTVNLKNPRPIDILKINHACSLNDTLWIKEAEEKNIYGENLEWNDVNLYEGFKEALGLVAFFGNTSSLGGNLKTPELTTNGMLGKAWRIIDGKIKLYKKGTTGASNAGNEPYSELIASKILSLMGIEHIEYEISKWEDVLCSVCDLYTNENIGFIPMKEVLNLEYGSQTQWTYAMVLEVCKKYSVEEEFKKMLFLDYLIINQDRHFGNFGFTINNDSREIIGFMPLFDHGYSLGNFMLDKEEIHEKLIEQGTFTNTRLLDQGRELSEEKFAKKMIKDVLINLDKINELKIPKKRIDMAKAIIKTTTILLREI